MLLVKPRLTTDRLTTVQALLRHYAQQRDAVDFVVVREMMLILHGALETQRDARTFAAVAEMAEQVLRLLGASQGYA